MTEPNLSPAQLEACARMIDALDALTAQFIPPDLSPTDRARAIVGTIAGLLAQRSEDPGTVEQLRAAIVAVGSHDPFWANQSAIAAQRAR